MPESERPDKISPWIASHLALAILPGVVIAFGIPFAMGGGISIVPKLASGALFTAGWAFLMWRVRRDYNAR